MHHKIKIITFLLLLVFITSVSANTLKPNLDFIIKDFEFQGETFNWEVYLEYSPALNAWVLKYVNTYPVDAWGTDQQDILQEINRYRSEGAPCSLGGLRPLQWDSNLETAALEHSVDMAVNNFFSHDGSNGSHFTTRIYQTGFQGRPRGENIAAAYNSPKSVVSGWINSPGHCRNIMDSTITHMGYGWAQKRGTQWNIYHTMVTGQR